MKLQFLWVKRKKKKKTTFNVSKTGPSKARNIKLKMKTFSCKKKKKIGKQFTCHHFPDASFIKKISTILTITFRQHEVKFVICFSYPPARASSSFGWDSREVYPYWTLLFGIYFCHRDGVYSSFYLFLLQCHLTSAELAEQSKIHLRIAFNMS